MHRFYVEVVENVKKHVVVEKSAFDSALSRMLKSKPVSRERVKTARKKPTKIIAAQPE